MGRHLEPLPGPFDEDLEPQDVEDAPLRRPAWWRWVAVVVALAMVVATPFAYALYLLLR